MTRLSSSTSSISAEPTPYPGCRWRYVRAGLLDYWWELQCPNPSQHQAQSERAKRLAPGLVGALGAVASLAAVLGAVLPSLARHGVALSGEHTLGLSAGLLALLGLATLALPVWLGLKLRDALRAACLRGWQLEQGLRKPFTRQGGGL